MVHPLLLLSTLSALGITLLPYNYSSAWTSPPRSPIVRTTTTTSHHHRLHNLSKTSDSNSIHSATTTVDNNMDDGSIISSWDRNNMNDMEMLERLTILELKERLRSVGQKVTGSKMELIQRLQLLLVSTSKTSQIIIQSQTMNAHTPESEQNQNIHIPQIHHHTLRQLPPPLREAFIRYTSSSTITSSGDHSASVGGGNTHDQEENASSSPIPSQSSLIKLLPIQQQSYSLISQGRDTVLFSPTGSGKSLAFIVPLAARLMEWKVDGSLKFKKEAQRQHFMKQQRGGGRTTSTTYYYNGNDSLSFSQEQQTNPKIDAASPLILIVEPSRELARQVGKIWNKFHPSSMTSGDGSHSERRRQHRHHHVVTVYGGVPMARHAALLGSKTDVVIGTPGRIRELIREKYLSTKHIRSIVLDEADILLNFGDNPEVEWLLDGMENDYQLILASATVNKRVEKFVTEVMELDVGKEGYVVVGSDNVLGHADTTDEIDSSGDVHDTIYSDSNVAMDVDTTNPAVRHWSMPASETSRVMITSDLIVTMTPRRCIVFVPTKAEAESVAQDLKERLSTTTDISIHVLHGDMVQQARSRTIRSFREELKYGSSRILVSTDVAARGLDLPAVDLVLQYCVPRKMGKEKTFDSELYIHRTGRAGRFGSTRSADAILLYDRSQGEVTTLNMLSEDLRQLHDIIILPKQLPSSTEVMKASYDRVVRLCERFNGERDGHTQSLVQYFEENLLAEMDTIRNGGSSSEECESFLIHRLAMAMASLSGLEKVVPARSLLTGDSTERTIQVRNEFINTLSPSEVTKIVKELGSGKVGRMYTCRDGSVVFDLDATKSSLLMKSVANNTIGGWHFNLPETLPEMA